MGNTASILNMIKHIGGEAVISYDKDAIDSAKALILPGVGSFDSAMERIIQNTCWNHYFCMPNKLFEYAMAGLPVLVFNMKEMAEFVTKHQMGVVIQDFSAAGINRALDDLLKTDLSEMKQNAYRAASENAWDAQEKKMIKAYRDLLLNAQGVSWIKM